MMDEPKAHRNIVTDGGVTVKTEPPDEDDGWLEPQTGYDYGQGIVLKIEPMEVTESSGGAEWSDPKNEAEEIKPETVSREKPTGGSEDDDRVNITDKTAQVAVSLDRLPEDSIGEEGTADSWEVVGAGAVDRGDSLFGSSKQDLHVHHEEGVPGGCRSEGVNGGIGNSRGWLPESTESASQIASFNKFSLKCSVNCERDGQLPESHEPGLLVVEHRNESIDIERAAGVHIGSFPGSLKRDWQEAFLEEPSGDILANSEDKDIQLVPAVKEDDREEVLGLGTDVGQEKCSEGLASVEPHHETECSRLPRKAADAVKTSEPKKKSSRLESVIKGLIRAKDTHKSRQVWNDKQLQTASPAVGNHGRNGSGTNYEGSIMEEGAVVTENPEGACPSSGEGKSSQNDQEASERGCGRDDPLERVGENIFEILSQDQHEGMDFAIESDGCTTIKKSGTTPGDSGSLADIPGGAINAAAATDKTNMNPRAPFRCTSCPKAYTTAAHLKRHMKDHTGERPFQCTHCGKSFTTVDKFKNHKMTHSGEKPFQCQYCEKRFIYSNKCKSHERTHTGEKPFSCNFCDSTFACRDKWRLHTKRMHAEEKGPYVCKFCNKGMETLAELVYHERGHTGYNPYKCSYCEVTCVSSSKLNRHIASHTGLRPYQCRFCDKAFTIKNYLTNHERIHLGDKRHQCSHCGKGFVTASALTIHIRVHTGERPFQCQFCNKSFVRSDALKHHEGTHTGERPFKCSMCDKAYTSSPHLRVHERTHLEERPYKCTYCGKGFTTSDKWRIHERIHTDEKPYQCTQCEAKFIKSTYLRRHEKSRHGGKRGGIGPADVKRVVIPIPSEVVEGVSDQQPVNSHMVEEGIAQEKSDTCVIPIQQAISGGDGVAPTGSDEVPAPQLASSGSDKIANGSDGHATPSETLVFNGAGVVSEESVEPVIPAQASVDDASRSMDIEGSGASEEVMAKVTSPGDLTGDCEWGDSVVPLDGDPERLGGGSQRDEMHIRISENIFEIFSQNPDGEMNSPIASDIGNTATEEPLMTSARSGFLNDAPGVVGMLPMKRCKAAKGTPNSTLSSKTSVNPQATFQCSSCSKAYTTAANLKRHMLSHSGEKPFQCGFCSKSFPTVDKFKNHEKIHTGEKPFQCQYCEKRFIYAEKCRSHERTHTGQKPFVCNFCDAAFTTRDKWRQHTKRKHAEEAGPYLCKFCNEGMKTMAELITHERGHTGYNPYQCSYCGVTCTSSSNLKRHIRNHTGQRPFQCRFCEKAFTIKNYLTNHERIHLGDKRHQCVHCGKGFVTASALTVHIRVHTGERPFQCQFCDKSFVRSDALKHHEGTHTGERPFKCSTCDKAYTSSPHLRVHERTHLEERPYKCTYCGKGFTTSDKWRIHERIHTGEKPYQCTHCEKSFINSTYLRRHEKSWHGGGKGGAGPADAEEVVISLPLESDVVNGESEEQPVVFREAGDNLVLDEPDTDMIPTQQAVSAKDIIVPKEAEDSILRGISCADSVVPNGSEGDVTPHQTVVHSGEDIVSKELGRQEMPAQGNVGFGETTSTEESGVSSDEIMARIRPLLD